MPCLQQQLQIHSCQKSILDDSISFTKRNKTCSFQVVLIFLVKLGPLTSNNGFVQRYFFYLFHAPFGIRYPPLERQARAQTTMICPYWGFIPRYFFVSVSCSLRDTMSRPLERHARAQTTVLCRSKVVGWHYFNEQWVSENWNIWIPDFMKFRFPMVAM